MKKTTPPKKLTSPRTSYKDLSSKQQAESDALFMSIGDGAISTDEFGKITRVNPMALEILGYKEDELIGEWFPNKIIAVGVDGQPVNLIDRPITKAFLTGHSVSEKMYYLLQNDEPLPVQVSVSPILVNNRPVGAIEVFRDVSLEEAIDRMKSEFISLASHQLRTPLSAIKTYAHMLVDGYMGDITPAQKKSLRTIIGATNRMNELISTLLNITRMETGSISVTPKTLSIDKVVEEVAKELSLMASEKNINLTLKNQGSNLQLKTDNLVLKEVLINLVGNAIKYTPDDGSVAVSIKGREQDILISIADTGWGIPEAAQEQIFSKFFRAQNIVQRETTGTGLGLYLARGLVERLGGKIWFNSHEGVGTTFWLSLPRNKQWSNKPARKETGL